MPGRGIFDSDVITKLPGRDRTLRSGVCNQMQQHSNNFYPTYISIYHNCLYLIFEILAIR